MPSNRIGSSVRSLSTRRVCLRRAQNISIFSGSRRGLDATTVRAKHPDKIYCLITGYGTDGPYAGRPTYDSVVQGATGIGGLFLTRDEKPAYVPLVICDHVVGEIAAGAILAALVKRNAEGQGCSLEIPMFLQSLSRLEYKGRNFALQRMSAMGHSRRFHDVPDESGSTPITDMRGSTGATVSA